MGWERKEITGFLVDYDTGDYLEFQHNPNDLLDEKAASYAAIRIPGMSHPRYQYVSGEPRRIAFRIELFKGDVKGQVEWLRSLLYPEHAGTMLRNAPHRQLARSVAPKLPCARRKPPSKPPPFAVAFPRSREGGHRCCAASGHGQCGSSRTSPYLASLRPIPATPHHGSMTPSEPATRTPGFLRALVAFLALPGMVAFAVPAVWVWLASPTLRWPAGLLAVALGVVALLWCVRDFHVSGKGTLAPWAPPRELVVSGLYRHSRNPMYVAVILILLGWAIAFMSTGLLLYASSVGIGFHLRVALGEEPWLARTHGEAWHRYARRVRRWF